MSMIVILGLSMNKCLFGKRMVNAWIVPVDDVSGGISGMFLTYFPDFMKEMEWLEKTEKEDVVKGLDELAQKLDVS